MISVFIASQLFCVASVRCNIWPRGNDALCCRGSRAGAGAAGDGGFVACRRNRSRGSRRVRAGSSRPILCKIREEKGRASSFAGSHQSWRATRVIRSRRLGADHCDTRLARRMCGGRCQGRPERRCPCPCPVHFPCSNPSPVRDTIARMPTNTPVLVVEEHFSRVGLFGLLSAVGQSTHTPWPLIPAGLPHHNLDDVRTCDGFGRNSNSTRKGSMPVSLSFSEQVHR